MDKIEKVARALAKADGYDPDKIITGEDNVIPGEWDVEDNDPDQHFKGQPRWKMYEREAKRFAAAFVALSSD
ncbi:hypothetical protein GOB57_31720 [Sinorhizobium meliloti]|nr:hypothetical protein [Sinorhizobium meliloti]